MADDRHAPLRARIEALLADTVSPRVTLARVALLLEAAVPGAECSFWLTPAGGPRVLLAGRARPSAGTTGPVVPADVADGENVLGQIELQLAPAALPSEAERALLGWLARRLLPLVRLAAGADVPRTPQPPQPVPTAHFSRQGT